MAYPDLAQAVLAFAMTCSKFSRFEAAPAICGRTRTPHHVHGGVILKAAMQAGDDLLHAAAPSG
jgi:hypothetical protein